jgi:hypothetical protein
MQLFIPASYKKEAERDAPPWACRFARVTGGWIAFDSDEALLRWKDTARCPHSGRDESKTASQKIGEPALQL